MAKRADIEARLSLDSSGFKNTLTKSKAAVGKWAKSVQGDIVRVGAAFFGFKMVKGIINLGTAAAETASKFDAVFGPSADAMNEKILELKENIPATTQEMQNALSTFSAMATAFGLNKAASDEFSVNMVKIAGDLASFHDMKPEEAFLKIRSAISGEFEPMKQLGIVMNEAMLKQEGLTLGIWDGVGAMSASQKALVVQSLLIKQMGVATGDAAATADSAANKIKFLQAKLKETGTEIGNTTLPAVVALVGAFSKLINVAKASSEAVGTFLAGGKAKDDPLGGFRESAEQNLRRQGMLRADVFNQQKDQIEEEAKRLKESVEARVEASKGQVEAESSVTAEVVDPERQKAADDYLKSLQDQIAAAGKLEGLTKATTSAASRSTKSGDPTGTNIEQGEFEARNDFLRRREQARQAKRILDDKVRQQAQTGESAGITDDLVQSARGNITAPSGQVAQTSRADSQSLTNIATDMKTVATELTRTQ